jgi:hypothetical protein
MEDKSIKERINEMKLAATNQTEFVQGIIILLMINCKALDEAIENLGDDDLKGAVHELRQSLPELLMAISTEVGLIHTQNNHLS